MFERKQQPGMMKQKTLMTGRHAAFIITRAAKKYLMKKHVK